MFCRKSLVGICLSVLALALPMTSVKSQFGCPGTPPSRLSVRDHGRTTLTGPTNLRSGPGTNYQRVRSIAEGTELAIIGGPECGTYTWWQIQLTDGTIGWAAEGDFTEYYLEPARVGIANSLSVNLEADILGSWEGGSTYPGNFITVFTETYTSDGRVFGSGGLCNWDGIYSFITPTIVEYDIHERCEHSAGQYTFRKSIEFNNGLLLLTDAEGNTAQYRQRATTADHRNLGPILSLSNSMPLNDSSEDHASDATELQDVRTLIDVSGRFHVPTAPLLRVGNEVVNNFYINASYIEYESGSVIIEVGGNEMGYQTSFSLDVPGYGEDSFAVTVFWSDREQAETAFLQRLGISEEVACRLNVVVQMFPVAGDLHIAEESPLSFCSEIHGGALAGEPVVVGNTVGEIVQSAVELYEMAPEVYQTYDLASYIVSAVQGTASPSATACAAISSLNVIAPGNQSIVKADFICTWGQAVIVFAKTGTLLGLTPILLEPEKYVDTWLDDVNEFAWSMPMTCLIFPEFPLCS